MPQQNRIIDIKRVESSPAEPVTLAEVKAQLIITFTDDDTKLTQLITQARKAIENYCAISIVAKTITMVADLYVEKELPYGPVTGIQAAQTRSGTQGSGPTQYETATGQWQTEGDEFLSFRPPLCGTFDINAPYTGIDQASYPNRWRIVYTAGYTTVPDDLKLAIMEEIAFRYEHRGNEPNVVYSEQAQALAFPYKRLLWL